MTYGGCWTHPSPGFGLGLGHQSAQRPKDPPPHPLHPRAAGTHLAPRSGENHEAAAGWLPPTGPECPLQGPASSEAPKGRHNSSSRPQRMQAVASQSCNCQEILRTAKARHPLRGLSAPMPTAGGSASPPAEGPPDGGLAEAKHHRSHRWTIPFSQQPQ